MRFRFRLSAPGILFIAASLAFASRLSAQGCDSRHDRETVEMRESARKRTWWRHRDRVPGTPDGPVRAAQNAAGGDNFLGLKDGADRVVGPVDLDALVNFTAGLTQPIHYAVEGRVLRSN